MGMNQQDGGGTMMDNKQITEIYKQVSDELCEGKEWCWSGVGGPITYFAALVIAAKDTSKKETFAELEQQLTVKDAEIERLLCVLGEIAGSKSLTATPTQFYQHLQRIASDATMTQDMEPKT
jgi:hypothetical protein